MKKTLLLIAFLFTITTYGQTPFPTGARFMNATKSDTISGQTRVPVFKAQNGNLLNYYVDVDDIIGEIDMPFVTPEEYGAVGNGTTDDSEAIQEAINSGYPVKLFPKTYYIATTLQLPNKASLSGYGERSVIKTDGDYNAIEIIGADVSIFRIGMLGSGKTSGFTNNNAIVLEGNAPTNQRTTLMLSNIFISDFGNSGFRQLTRTSLTYQASSIVSNVSIARCQIGFDLDIRGEYNSFSNIIAHDNVIGVRMAGGNNNFVGGQITNNVDGVVMTAGSNDGHSVMSGTMINHNSSNSIKTNGIIQGYLFQGCMIYAGSGGGKYIEIIDSQKVKFVNCDIDVDEVRSANSTDIEFDSNKWITTPTFTDDYLSGGVSDIRFFNENFIEGGEPSYIKSSILGDFTIIGDIKADKLSVSALNTAPATSTSAGTAGEIRFTATHIYVCTATNTWVRAALTTW